MVLGKHIHGMVCHGLLFVCMHHAPRPKAHASIVCIGLQDIRAGCMQTCLPDNPSQASVPLSTSLVGVPCLCRHASIALCFAMSSRLCITSSAGSFVAPWHAWIYCNDAIALCLPQLGHIALSRASCLAHPFRCLFSVLVARN